MKVCMLTQQSASQLKTPGAPGVVEVWDIGRLKPNPLNPRGELSVDDPTVQELAVSITVHGLQQPITSTPQGFVIAGHRRRLACIIAGVKRVRVIVHRMSETDQLLNMMIENEQRKDLTLLQKAKGYAQLKEQGLSVRDIGRQTGISFHAISQLLDLLKLPEKVQRFISDGLLPQGAISILLNLNDSGLQESWAERARTANWSLAILKKAIEGTGNQPSGNASQLKPVEDKQGREILTRETAIASLKQKRNFPVTIDIFNRAVESTPCSCSGITGVKAEKLCATCPFACFLATLLREVHDARS